MTRASARSHFRDAIRSDPVPQRAARSLYHEMLAHPDSPILYVHEDGLITPGQRRPTREELIKGYMSTKQFTMKRKTNGDPGYDTSGTTFASREQAERAAEGWAVREPEQETKAA